MKPLILLILFSVGVYASWSDYIAPVIKQHFPRELYLTNKDGDDISITLIRRDEKNVYFRMKGSPTIHKYEIARLNYLSRCKIKLYPKSSPKQTSSPKPTPWKSDDPTQQHLNSMYKKREDLKKQVKVLKTKMGVEAKKAKLLEYKGSTERKRTVLEAISTEISELDVEIYQLTYKIEDLIYHYPHLVPSK